MKAHIGIDANSGLAHTMVGPSASVNDFMLMDEPERVNVRIRVKVEYAFEALKRPLGDQKVRCRGLTKNMAQITTLFALANW